MSAILEAAMQLKAARDNEARARMDLEVLGARAPQEVREAFAAALDALNEATAVRMLAEMAYRRLTEGSDYPRPFSVVEVEGE